MSIAVQQQLLVARARQKKIRALGRHCCVCDKEQRKASLWFLHFHVFPGETLEENLRSSAPRALFVGALLLPLLVT